MSSERAVKRRKLDLHNDSLPISTSLSPNTSVPTTLPSKRTPQSRHVATLPEKSAPRSISQRTASGHEAWQEAKARRDAGKPKAAPVSDIYDDIEGAHAQDPLGVRSAVQARKKAALDPLRNQKANGNGMQESPRKGAAALGFFKQFHSPKKTSTPPTQEPGNSSVNGVNGGGKANGRLDAQTKRDDSGDILREALHSAATDPENPMSSQLAGSTERKKTFEDQIKEVEEAARKDAEQQSEAGTPTAPSLRRRAGARHVGHTDKETKPIAKSRPGSVTSTKARPAAKRQPKHVDQSGSHVSEDLSSRDEMQVDDLESNVKISMPPNPSRVEPLSNHILAISKSSIEAPDVHKRSKLEHTFTSKQLGLIQTIVLEKLTGKRPIPLTNLGDEYAKVSQMVNQTIVAGESNSMLLIGARGSGKTALVNCVLREQASRHAGDFHVVRLNGFIHTDDKIALREIWRQLGREMEPENEDETAKNYADTLTTLLALLSHSSEMGGEQPDQVTKSVIFILDEFELFAGHPRQTLLYNLFDIAQSRKAPIAVLGLTTRIDVAESLEKRVKSRFSHRYVHLSLAKSFAAFQETCKISLAMQLDGLSMEERTHLGTISDKSANTQRTGSVDGMTATLAWNAVIKDLMSTSTITSHLRRIYYTTKSVLEFLVEMLMPIALLPTEANTDSATILEHLSRGMASSLRGPDSKLDLLASLSTLQLALLICAARLNAIHNTEVVSFALAYEEYKVLASKAKLQASASGSLAQGAGARISNKDVAKSAWDELIDSGLVMNDGRVGGRVDVGLEELGICGVELGQWGRWCKEI